MLRVVAAVTMVITAASALAAPARPDAPEKAAGDRNTVVCKRFVETGSLVRGYRTCKTKGEWERERDNLRTLGVANGCRDRSNGALCG